jgi:hypothetical protein
MSTGGAPRQVGIMTVALSCVAFLAWIALIGGDCSGSSFVYRFPLPANITGGTVSLLIENQFRR